MASRNLDDLVPELKVKCLRLKEEAAKVGINFVITCTARNLTEQVALYAQGRQTLADTNKLRTLAGLSVITEKENKNKITWTLASKHIINLNDDVKNNDKAKAFDVALIDENKKISWDTIKLNVNKNQKADYLELAEIGRGIGLTCGAFWKTPDFPHYEI